MSAFSSRSKGYKTGIFLLFSGMCLGAVGLVTDCSRGVGGRVIAGLQLMCESPGVFLLLIACIYALCTNCCKPTPPPRRRVLEILAGTGGILGIVGIITMLATEAWGGMMFLKSSAYFYMTIVGNLLCIVAAIVIAMYNEDVSQSNAGETATTETSHPSDHPVTFQQMGAYLYMAMLGNLLSTVAARAIVNNYNNDVSQSDAGETPMTETSHAYEQLPHVYEQLPRRF